MGFELRVLLGIVFVVAIAFSVFAIVFRKDEAARLLPGSPVRERIRREVHEEFEQALRSAKGFRRWMLLLKRNREVSRRVGRVIFNSHG